MTWKKGDVGNPKGRPKGCFRPKTLLIKEAKSVILKDHLRAYKKLGGFDQFFDWAQGNKDKFYPSLLKLLFRLLPKDSALEEIDKMDKKISIEIVKFGGEPIEKKDESTNKQLAAKMVSETPLGLPGEWGDKGSPGSA